MDIEFVLRGTTALLMHNPQMVDPDFEITRAIKSLTGKKKKTDADLQEVARLEWHGGLYTAEIGGRMVVSQPLSKVRKCLINAARISKQGKQVERSVIMGQLNVPLIYAGSENAKDGAAEVARLFADRSHHSRLSVGVGSKRVMRVRPQFFPWALIVPAFFVQDAGLNFDELQRIFELAGVSERIGDNRVNGYGSFRAHVRPLAGAKPIRPSIAGVDEFFDSLERRKAA